jgi:hypothetical protein
MRNEAPDITGIVGNSLADYNQAVTKQHMGSVLIINSKDGSFSETRGKCHSRVIKDAQDKFKKVRIQ